MQITVRLYRQHDMDLVALYRTPGFRFQKVMKEAITAFATRQDFHIKRPKDAEIEAGYVPRSVQMHISLDPEKDKEAVKALSYIRVGYRSSFLKALFRRYLTAEPLDAYRDRDDLIFDAEKDYITDHHGPKEQPGQKDRPKKTPQRSRTKDKRPDTSDNSKSNAGRTARADDRADRKTSADSTVYQMDTSGHVKDTAMSERKDNETDRQNNIQETAVQERPQIKQRPEQEHFYQEKDQNENFPWDEPDMEKPPEKEPQAADAEVSDRKNSVDDLFPEDTGDAEDYTDILKAMNKLAH